MVGKCGCVYNFLQIVNYFARNVLKVYKIKILF